MTSIVAWDLPTFLLVFSFSLFTYYVAKLNIEIEKDLPNNGNEEHFKEGFYLMRDGIGNQMNDHHRRNSQQDGNQRKNRSQKANQNEKYNKFRANLLIPFVVFFNALAFISFVLILASYFKEVNQGAWQQLISKEDWWEAQEYFDYSKSIKGLTGLIFMILGISILNYGTKLETAISNQIQRNHQSASARELSGIDIRILTITILLSMVFLCRALVDSLFAWTLLKTNLHYPQLSLVLITFTEIAPCIIITQIMKKDYSKSKDQSEIELILSGQEYKINRKSRSPNKKVQSPYDGIREVSDKLLTYQQVQYYSGIKQSDKLNLKHFNKDLSEKFKQHNQHDSDSDDSMFGSFNPNLNTKDYEQTHSRRNGTDCKKSSLNRGGSLETLSRFTVKTGSYKGHIMLEKAPDDHSINTGTHDGIEPFAQTTRISYNLGMINNGSQTFRRLHDFIEEKNVVQEMPNESIYTNNSLKGDSESDESSNYDEDSNESEENDLENLKYKRDSKHNQQRKK
eukprot:403347645